LGERSAQRKGKHALRIAKSIISAKRKGKAPSEYRGSYIFPQKKISAKKKSPCLSAAKARSATKKEMINEILIVALGSFSN